MKAWRGLAPLLFLSAVTVRAQDAGNMPPKLGQPADFSGLVGTFQIRAEAKPAKVAVEEPITLTVTITGRAVAPHVPKRDNLRLFPGGTERDFFIEPGDEREADGAWEFTFHLRPKHARVQFVPGLKLVYYAPRQRRYQSAYADAIPLTVTARPDRAMKIEGLKVIQAPASFFELTKEDTTDWGFFAAVVLILGPQYLLRWSIVPPLFCVPVACWWHWRRRRHADRIRRQKRLVDQTAAALATPPCDAALITRLLTNYLRQRLDFPVAEATPAEVERWLKRRGVARQVREQWRELLQGYDARRFAPGPDQRMAMDGTEAIELIHLLEEDACLAGR